MSLFAILCGTLPIGYAVWPNIIGFLLGWLLTGLWTYFYCVAVVNATGRFSPALEGWLRFVKKGDSELEVLRVDTVKFYNEDATLAVADKDEEGGSEEDNLIKTKDVDDESPPPTYDEESPVAETEVAEEAVPVEMEEAVDDSMVRSSMHSEASYKA